MIDHLGAMIVRDLRIMPRTILTIALLLPMLGVAACADREQVRAKQMAEEADAASADDAACRPKGAPGTEPYESCRKELAQARAERNAIQYQKRRDFDRVLGAGTSDTGGSY
ncbi:MAG: hypothetical protein ACM3MH_00225 [Actinomycetota bacterium]